MTTFTRIKKSLTIYLAASTFLIGLPSLSANDYSHKGKGLIAATEEETYDVEHNWPSIVGVKPNSIGLSRIQEHRKSQGKPPLMMDAAEHGEEFIYAKGIHNHHDLAIESAIETTDLPPSVNNFTLPSFPPVGDQGSLGSCTCWAFLYYLGSHEYGLLNNINNKQNGNNFLFSPSWGYNLCNNGTDSGSSIAGVSNLMATNGTAFLVEVPYNENDYSSWDPNVNHWTAALSRRFQHPVTVTGLNTVPQNLQVIKQLLNNGHVLTFTTYIESWQYSIVKKYPNGPNTNINKAIVTYQNGTSGLHEITIVGYDDTVWADVNGNGVVDPGEMGAFIVANSWGTLYENSGHALVSYDAFLTNSAVVNGPTANRQPIAGVNGLAYTALPIAKHYQPKLIGQFSLSQSLRNQISVMAGVSSTSSTVPTTNASYTLMKQGGPYSFDGNQYGTVETMTFAVDFTDLLPATDGPQRYYLSVIDSTTGNPTTLNSFTLIDTYNNKSIPCTTTPMSCDHGTALAYVDYSYVTTPPPPTPPTVSITGPTNPGKTPSFFTAVAQPTDAVGIKSVEFFIDGVSMGVVKKAPYQLGITTSQGPHTLSVVATNLAGLTGSASLAISVRL